MSAFSDLINIYQMEEISKNTRCNIIIKLGRLINDEYCSNITEPIVYELISLLNPQHEILDNEHFLALAGVNHNEIKKEI